MKTNTYLQTMNRSWKRFFQKGTTAILALAVLLSGLLAASAHAGGPASRPTFTSASPADHVVFNAITDNPEHGDERNFVLIREAGTGTYVNQINLEVGKEYEVYSYFHNNAKTILNTGAGTGIARNVRMIADVPTVVKPGETGRISTTITADNATPQKVWDEAYVTTSTAVALRYVPASAIIHSGGAVNGSILPETLFSSAGTFIGYTALNGVIPGCADYAGYVIYKLKVDKPAFEVSKDVSVSGAADWKDTVASKPGAKVDFRVTYKNTGTTDQTNVVLKDSLPKGLTYVAGSSRLTNTSNPNGLAVNDGIITASGINIGNYGPGTTATVTFSATVDKTNDVFICGANSFTNKASASTSNGTKEDTAKVTITVECAANECKPGIPTGDERCSEKCTPKEGEVVDANGNCVPAALPTTGPAQIVAGILGVILVSMGVAYWIHSRMQYKRALAGFTEEFSEEPAEHLLTARTDTAEKHARSFHR